MFLRNIYCYLKYRRYNTNLTPTIISSNCIEGVVYSDMKLKFQSPTINLYFSPKDFIKFCSNLKYYLSQPLVWIKSDVNCPTGMLDDVIIYFLHYKSELEAELKWNERKQRVNYENLFFIMTDRDGCTYDDLKAFDTLNNCKNKVIFTHKHYPEIPSAFHIKGFSNDLQVGILTKFKCLWYRYLDEFDWRKFLNV